MGLTVHYRLHSDAVSPQAARALVAKLANRARELPFQRVHPVESQPGKSAECEAGDYEAIDRGEDSLWLCTTARIERRAKHYEVRPRHGFAFFVVPGPGSEWAALGLVKHPQSIALPGGGRLRTGLAGWSWSGFCKTQYASNPRYGGFENFRRCHVSLIELLDFAEEIGMQVDVQDEGQYAVLRDIDSRREEVSRWNEFVAATVGHIRDALPGESDAPITKFPNFEHLEARGGAASKRSL